MWDELNPKELKKNFLGCNFENEDDIKLHFHAEIINPILKKVNPSRIREYRSEKRLVYGGRPDATFPQIQIELKKENYFNKKSGVDEALFGRPGTIKSYGLYHYIVNDAQLAKTDSAEEMIAKITNNIGVGFDGKRFIFARFINTDVGELVDFSKTNIRFKPVPKLPLHFDYEVVDFELGLRRLALLMKQRDKVVLNKKNVLNIINTKNAFVRESILSIYRELHQCITSGDSAQIKMLFSEWDRVFGVMYGEDEQATEFTKVTPAIKEAYGLEESIEIDSKLYLFAMQTFFNIFLKLLIYSFLSQLISPTFTTKTQLNKGKINQLFRGKNEQENKIIDNFFEVHFLEWFTYSSSGFEVPIVNQILESIDEFDLSTYILKPEEVQDILQEVYMELIPPKMRHLMGEYFSPDWIVEHALDMAGYTGDIEKTLIDPASGSGTFLTQALKRIIKAKNGKLTKEDLIKITNHIVGFDINPISVVSAKANFILILFSAYFDYLDKEFGDALSIPIYIADSILSPVVYAEENDATLEIQTAAGKFVIPKFSSYKNASRFLKTLTGEIELVPRFDRFWKKVHPTLVDEQDRPVVEKLFGQFVRKERAPFWPAILRNSFAPVMIGNKFDFVVGNPPWIAWKSMSKSYREGTLKIWKSYGIFEKSAYDKKTTHDDFGMAVTYVAVDQYLREGGHMVFLLPASFLKSTKGGEGFRKLSITRKGQDIPFSVREVDDFSGVRLFTISTVAIHFYKGEQMRYPLEAYHIWTQTGRKSNMDSHDKWSDVLPRLSCETVYA